MKAALFNWTPVETSPAKLMQAETIIMTQNSQEPCTVGVRASAAWIRVVLAKLALLLTAPVWAQVSFDQPPIDYFSATPNDSITKLQAKIDAGNLQLDHSSPLSQRWGGWYVTGQHGAQRHLGNLLVRSSDTPQDVDMDKGANIVSLSKYCDTSAYLSGHSDVVALMVLEHQTSMHNLITKANFVTRIALRDQQVINEMLGRPADYQSESTNRRIQSVVEPVVQHLLFTDEVVLTDTIAGTSDFAREFTSAGARDKSGRSLRQFDLQRRLFKYPCSYLIYSEAFDKLPELAQDGVYRRLWDALTEEDTSDAFRHSSSDDRKAILEILRDTKPGLPEYWRNDEGNPNDA